MSQFDKISVREEVERCKNAFEKLLSEKKVSPELEALCKTMLMIISLLVTIFMEKMTKKTAKNSSKPSSQTEKDDSTPVEEGSHKKDRKEKDALFCNARSKIEKVTIPANYCDHCGTDISHEKVREYEKRVLIDIIFEKVEKQVTAEVKECPKCHSVCKGEFPSNMPGPLQYGIGVIAFVINMVIAQMVALNRIQKLLKSLIGVILSQATLLKYVWQLHTALENWEKSSIEQILKQKTINTDETSMRVISSAEEDPKVKKKNQWVHVLSGGDITLKFLHPKRGKEAIEDIGVIPRYGGTIIHDCWSSYLTYDHCEHGLCGSHLLRELTFVVESNDYRWAKNMKRLLKATCKLISKREIKRLTKKEYRNLQKRYRNILSRGDKEMPEIPPKQNGKRGKMAKSDAHNLWERLKQYEDAVLLFAKKSHVPFTNNRAERDLRMGKVKQKISGCFRSERYAKAYCRISSYLQTMANKGYNPLIAIQIALEGDAAKIMGE